MNDVSPAPPSAHVMAPAQDSLPAAGGPSMRRYVPGLSAQRKELIISEARAAGRMGAQRLPDIVHAECASDSMLTRALDAYELGLRERAGT